MAMRITKQQRLLLPFLQKKEREAIPFTLEELSEASTYPLRESVLAKISRSEWDPFIVKIDGQYFAQGTLGIGVDEFAIRTSSRFRNSSPISNEINTMPSTAKELLRKSSDEFLLAIEIFNRPTAPNRIEAFVIHFILAFEKLLKAHIIINLGESKIWNNSSTKRHTISIRDALKLLF